MPHAGQRGAGGDTLVAVALAAVLGAGWSFAARGDLAALRLPDTDDVMRLVQVRDWLAGQGWRDLAQHRAGDLPMHWTRPGDLGPAALIALLSPATGRHAAEVAAVTLWPLLLFGAALLLIQRVARALPAGAAPPALAAVVAALAYPATTVFAPGRIDHHGLQLVLLLGAVAAQLGPATAAGGAMVGIAAAASLVIGLETMPFFAMLGAAGLAGWVAGRRGRGWMAGLGGGALVGLAAGVAGFAPVAFGYPACDGFTADAARFAGALAPVPLLLAAPGLTTVRRRLVAATMLGGVAVAVAIGLSPRCLSPYGAVDPRLAATWLAQVGEAQPLFAAPRSSALAYAALPVIGLGATLWRWHRERTRGWALLALLVATSVAMTVVQLRGAYAGALLAAPGLAAMVAAARRRGGWRVVAAWTGAAGIVWPLAAAPLAPPPDPAADDCLRPATIAGLRGLPPGLVLAPVDAGPAILRDTPHRVLAAPYHRNAAGNLLAADLYRGAAPPRSLYLLTCPATGPPPTWARFVARAGDAGLWVLSGDGARR